MKKFFTIALAALSIMGMSAADKVIYQNGVLADGLRVEKWYAAGYNLSAANPDGTGNVYEFHSEGDITNGCMGFLNGGANFYNGILNNSTLEFEWYSTGAARYTIRLTAETGAEENYVFYATEENINKWNKVSLPVATTFPQVNTQWREFKGDGGGYVFAIIQNDNEAGTTIYFNNIIYKNIDESWKAPEIEVLPAPTTVPVPTHPAADVLSVFSGAYSPAIQFEIGGWGQTTKVEDKTIDGAPVEYLRMFNYLGWQLIGTLDLTDYQYMHVDYYTPNGTTLGICPISNLNGVTKDPLRMMPSVKQNEWNSYDLKLSDFPIDLNSVFQIKFADAGNCEGYIANVYFYKQEGGNDPEPPMTDAKVFKGTVNSVVDTAVGGEKSYPYTLNYTVTYTTDKNLIIEAEYDWKNGEPVGIVPGSVFINGQNNEFIQSGNTRKTTTATTYNAGDTINIEFYIPIAGNVAKDMISYVVGSQNDNVAVEGIDSENAPVEFFTLQGVRVANPENGLFIRRQGNNVNKVIIR
ncbi:MAG: hypothetical protein K2N03_00110 [Muribaculaceae bacterium]|nr:hypothetical protein [Muribaculaceae bacterium]